MIRSRFIKFANDRNKSYDVGWSYLKLNDRYQRTTPPNRRYTQ
jgi:hypothetical protein